MHISDSFLHLWSLVLIPVSYGGKSLVENDHLKIIKEENNLGKNITLSRKHSSFHNENLEEVILLNFDRNKTVSETAGSNTEELGKPYFKKK